MNAPSIDIVPADRQDRDQGAVLVLALVMLVIGGIISAGLLTYATGVLKAAPVVRTRTVGAEGVKSATRMAITLQRDYGPKGCFAPSATWNLNGADVAVTCTTLQTYTSGSGRYGLILTSNISSDWNLNGNGTSPLKDLDGNVFLNAGRVDGKTSDMLVRNADITLSSYTSASTPAARYSAGGPAVDCNDPGLAAASAFPSAPSGLTGESYTHTMTCTADPWWTRAGDNPSGTSWSYPKLAALPTFERPGSQAALGACTLYYPGRYYGSTPLVLDGGQHYFASGVYYFERPVIIKNGAQVVAGEGRYAGCAYDADAAFAPTAPRSHEITGKGATFLLGSSATISVENASLRMNRRVSTATTRGSEGVSIRSVSFGVATTDVEVPADVVQLADGATVPAISHTIRPSATGPAIGFRASTLTPKSSSPILDVKLGGAVGSSNRVLLDGYVFVPNAPVRVQGSTDQYELRLGGGLVAARLELGLNNLPAGGVSAYTVGVLTEAIQRKVQLRATTAVNGKTMSSTAVVEVHADRSYAINSWTIDI
jgi:hypothetical protein